MALLIQKLLQSIEKICNMNTMINTKKHYVTKKANGLGGRYN